MKGMSLESHVQYVYQVLLNLEGENQVVSKNVRLRGRSKALHEFDVFYEFTRANVRHRVAIECKDWKGPVRKKEVAEHHAKLVDIGNVVGCIVSGQGFQRGAVTYAKHYGIMLLTLADLPSIYELLSLQIGATSLPEPGTIGQPFWAVMEVGPNGQITGTYGAIQTVDPVARLCPLFFSRRHAEAYCALRKDIVVRGINQKQLRALLKIAEFVQMDFLCIVEEPPDTQWRGIPMSRAQVARDYLVAGVH